MFEIIKKNLLLPSKQSLITARIAHWLLNENMHSANEKFCGIWRLKPNTIVRKGLRCYRKKTGVYHCRYEILFQCHSNALHLHAHEAAHGQVFTFIEEHCHQCNIWLVNCYHQSVCYTHDRSSTCNTCSKTCIIHTKLATYTIMTIYISL